MAPKPGQMPLPTPAGDTDDRELPLIYVASALTHLDEQGKLLVDAWCYVIKTAVEEASEDLIRTYLPVQWSDPQNPEDDRPPAAIYELNSGKLREEVDALIVLGYRGGSLGAGQEFAWAAGLRMPILFLRDGDRPMSRQIEGTPADLTIADFANAEQIADAVRAFVREKWAVLEDGARRRRNRATQFTALAEAMLEAWKKLDIQAREALSAESRLDMRRIEELIGNPLALGVAALDELAALSGGLGIDLGRWLGPASLPNLDARQLAALRTASAENGWPGDETLELLRAAQIELGRGGARRLRLASPEDWIRFKEKRQQ